MAENPGAYFINGVDQRTYAERDKENKANKAQADAEMKRRMAIRAAAVAERSLKPLWSSMGTQAGHTVTNSSNYTRPVK